MRVKAFLIFALVIILSTAIYFLNINQPKQEVSTEAKVSGAFKSLAHWNDQRAYPQKNIPKSGYYAAFEYSRKNLNKGGVDSEVEPWKSIGPHNIGGRTLAIAFNPQNPNTIYAGSASGGLWRSTSGGVGINAWEHISTGLPVLAVSTISIVSNDSNTIYIGTGEVYNYQNTGTGFTIRPTRGSYGIGILKTVDGGRTWTKSLDWTSNQERGVWAVRIDPQNPNTVWAGTTEGVFKSIDAGQNWQQVHSTIMIMDLAINPADPNTVFVSAGNLFSEGLGVYRTQDGGGTWDKMQGLPSSFGGKAMLAISPSSPNIVFASIGHSTNSSNGATWLVKSEDNGDTWSTVSRQDYSRWQGWFAHDVAVHPDQPGTVITIGIDIWKSTTGGANLSLKSTRDWRLGERTPIGGQDGRSPTYSHADHHDVAYHPTDPDIIYFANDGGVYRTTDGGETFESCNGGYQTTQFYQGFACSQNDPLLCMGGMQDNASAIYDGQLGWIRVIGGDGGFAAIDPTNDNIMYGSWQRLNMLRSTDRGDTWNTITPPSGGATSFIAPYALSPSEPQVLYAGRTLIFKSGNSGSSWSTQNRGEPLDNNPLLAFAISYQTSSTLYATTAPTNVKPGIFRSLNGGTDWTNITGPLPDRYPVDIVVDPNDDQTVYVVFSGFGTSHVFKSANGGDIWEDIGQSLPDVPTTAVVVDPLNPDHIYIGNDLGVYVSLDGGATWQEFFAGLTDAVIAMDLTISPVNRKLRMATHGNGAFERGLIGAPTTVENPDAAISDFRLAQNYPNPFNPTTTIDYRLPAEAKVVLKIYNLLGEEVVTLVNAIQTAGGKSVAWDGTNRFGQQVSSGTYIYKITTGNFTSSRKMMFLK